MALTGTLKDFGMADILQLIGQQRKSGVLNVQDKKSSVQIYFVEGSIVRATAENRNKQDLLGMMMVRADILTEAQLEQALAIQKRTLRRLGDILIGEGMLDKATFRQMYQLQTTETVYGLFRWKSGTYAFEQQEVDYDPGSIIPIDSETALMEGFRMVDEWPMVKKRIGSYEMTFRRVRSLDEPHQEKDKTKELGPNERAVYSLADEDTTVRRIIDLSRLGEFETCSALGKLTELGYLEALAPSRSGRRLGGQAKIDVLGSLRRAVAQVAVGCAVLAGVGALSYLALSSESGVARMVMPRGGQDAVASHMRARIEFAVEVFRLETGTLPGSLSELVEAGLLSRLETQYPYFGEWFYRIADSEPEGYLLLSPIP